MSVTFWMPLAPTERVRPHEDEPEYGEERPVPPFIEINLSQSNAIAILALIDPDRRFDDGDIYGEWDMNDLARIRKNIIWALNTKAKFGLELTGSVEGGDGRCRVINGGRSSIYIEGRLKQFLALAEVAMAHNFPVHFA